MAPTREEIADYNRAYRIAHQEEIATYQTAYRATHQKEKIARDATYRAVHRSEDKARSAAYRATHPKERAAYYAMHREEAIAYAHAYRTAHREETLAQGRVYGAAHRDKKTTYNKAYSKAHPQEMAERYRRRRALKRGATVGPIDLEAIKIRDRMMCAICGKRVSVKDLSFDHSHPLSLLGPHSQENLRVAHLRCNIRRGAGRLPVQMILV